jgi:hypothetical protein
MFDMSLNFIDMAFFYMLKAKNIVVIKFFLLMCYSQGRIQGEEWGGPKQRKKNGRGPELKKKKNTA